VPHSTTGQDEFPCNFDPSLEILLRVLSPSDILYLFGHEEYIKTLVDRPVLP